ncbi:Uncharacterised protein [Salmonella enterica subsp. enterica serovar Typhimurium str. DT104]|nr:Uncharacterised protein [Salmonella enterica subsp. enterica serovar Typhimurium str. DT104]VFR99339.1 Uncharacterised protein [Salmonella enterica subsp. enterica serovar Typhimurium]CQB01691.1 Uncharacterised protein [Salmonella enterica subsp. enterica serovar Typhimurium str. DT104]CQC32515.1 Uncharacterised protein [Salmonella enterica subsp. enterica serovar Typhimurium str. DT104]CQC35803.1 Uncharacterised protein [Salmonella enterica subsp. enterica serovar Typhimurium str. DT104]
MSECACAVRHSHILSRKFPPFLGFLSVADRTTNETKCSLYECALREIPRLPVCRSRGTAVARKRQNDLLSGCQNCALTWRAARRKNCRHCASVPVTQTRRNRDRMCNRITAHARLYDYHLVRASPRHLANASRSAKKFRVPLTVPELVKQKIAGSRASGVGSDFVIDDGTGKILGVVVGVTE